MNGKKIILVGFFEEIVELCEECGYEILGYVEDAPNGSKYEFLGNDEYMMQEAERYKDIHLCLVPDNPKTRKRLYDKYHNAGYEFETVISPVAKVSKSAMIGEGCMVQAGCNVSASVHLGKCARLNCCANIMHDVWIDDFCVVAPSAVLLGQCRIQNGSYVGANATLLPNVMIDGVIVGAGAVVTKSIRKKTVVGIPAREIVYSHL